MGFTCADTETATKPITARYVSGLQALAVAATKKGDLASALAIQSELARFSAVGRWRFQSNNATETRELHPNGTFTTATGRKDLRGTWSVEPAGLVLRYSGGGTETFPVPFDPSGTKGHSTGNFDVTISKLSTQ